MSQLTLTTNNGRQFALNVLEFSSPIYTTFNGGQCRNLYQWFPIKVNMPELELNVQFASEFDYELFQAYVRSSQVTSLTTSGNTPQITLYWPQRNINNWTGYIRSFRAGGRRANYAPQAKFTVDIASGLISKLTQGSSYGFLFSALNGVGLTSASLGQADGLIAPPASIFGSAPLPSVGPVLGTAPIR